VLGALLIPLLACPITSIPARDYETGHYLASPYGGISELEPTPVAPRSAPTLETSLPLWDLDASLAEVERQLALDVPPTDAPWVAWALAGATRSGKYQHLLDALASSELTAEQLAWWRSIEPDPIFVLRDALDRSTSARTRALLTTALALTEYANSCPVAVDIDGACRAPGTQLLLRRSMISLERAQEWTKLARKRWSKLDVDDADLATRALLAELELAVTSTDYEALLDEGAPDDLWFVVEEWRKDSGVPAWEDAYEHQLARAEESKARYGAFIESITDCARTQLEVHGRLLWIDARSSGVALLRNARIMIAFAEMLDAADDGLDPPGTTWSYVCERASDPVREQAYLALEVCIELANVTLDDALHRACRATLWEMDWDGEAPLVEFVLEPRASTTVHRSGVARL
jgi:hypothetical protein